MAVRETRHRPSASAVTAEDVIKLIQSSFKNIEAKPSEDTNAPRVFMFFSGDLVNSTKFKTKYAKEWAAIFMKFYETTIKHVEKVEGCGRIKMWKYVGDEVLFYSEIKEVEQIVSAPGTLHAVMESAQKEFHAADKDGIIKNFLYFKGALWIAAAQRYVPEKESINIYFDVQEGALEFLGVEIDEGFRMAVNASPGKLVIDPKIAYLICIDSKKDTQIPVHALPENVKETTCKPAEQKMRLIDCIKLKGIWEERRFPIIWYADNWGTINEFLYDEKHMSDLVKNYLRVTEGERFASNVIKIFTDLGFPLRSIEVILKALER